MTADQSIGRGADFRRAKAAVDAAIGGNELPSCALNDTGLEEQQARQARLAPSVTNLERRGKALIFAFAEDFDRQALAEMVAVEEHCCPFFDFAFDEDGRELTVGVKQNEMLPALEAIASHLGARWEAEHQPGAARSVSDR